MKINNKDIRTVALIGERNFNKLQNSHVTIIGVGGVGGACAEMIARAGVKNLKLIDFDTFEASNRNRQLGALISTDGLKKVEAFKKRFLDIDETLNIEAVDTLVDKGNVKELIDGSDYVIDMCDDVDAKVAIINHCYYNKINFMSAMGAGNRIDISNLKIAKLSKTSYCPLAKKLRQRLGKSVQEKTKVAYYEGEIIPMKKGQDFVGTISFSPNYMGIRIAGEVINDLLKR